ncbi:MAG: hypothetical protein ABW190_15490 [Rhizobacter sp.]
MKLFSALAVVCVLGVLGGAKIAHEGHFLHGTITDAREQLRTGQSKPDLGFIEGLTILALVVGAREDPQHLDREARAADLKLWGGAALAGASMLGLLVLAVLSLRDAPARRR